IVVNNEQSQFRLDLNPIFKKYGRPKISLLIPTMASKRKLIFNKLKCQHWIAFYSEQQCFFIMRSSNSRFITIHLYGKKHIFIKLLFLFSEVFANYFLFLYTYLIKFIYVSQGKPPITHDVMKLQINR